MKQKHRIRGYIVFTIVLALLLLGMHSVPGFEKFTSPSYVRDWLLGFGAWAFLAYIVLIIGTIPLPIPSTPLILAGGYVFGFWNGIFLAQGAAVLGAILSFYVVRKEGKPLVEKMVDRHHLVHFLKIFEKRGNVAALVAYAIPLFPSDVVNMILGLTKVRFRHFIWIVFIGHIPRYFIVNSIGSDLQTGFTIKTVVAVIVGVVFVLIALCREPLKRFFFKELRTLEREVGITSKKTRSSKAGGRKNGN